MMNRTIAPIALAAMAAYFDGLGTGTPVPRTCPPRVKRCRDCSAEIDRRQILCGPCRSRRLAAQTNG